MAIVILKLQEQQPALHYSEGYDAHVVNNFIFTI